ncbi:hypothetical protein [Listeria goaensis]|nr:hypothetical protein [Listeria goaensis]
MIKNDFPDSHGWYLESNEYSNYQGKWRRSIKGAKRITIKKAKGWKKK